MSTHSRARFIRRALTPRVCGVQKGYFDDGEYKEPKEQIYNLCEVNAPCDWRQFVFLWSQISAGDERM